MINKMNSQSRKEICTNPVKKSTLENLIKKGVRIINNYYDVSGKLLSKELASEEYCRDI
jgi:hypothetical protein